MTFADIPIGGRIVSENFNDFVKMSEDGLVCRGTETDMCFSQKENTGDKVWQNNGCNLYHFSTSNQRIGEISEGAVVDYSGERVKYAYKLKDLETINEHFEIKDIVTYTSERNLKSEHNFDIYYVEKTYGWLPSVDDICKPWWKEYIKAYPINRYWSTQLMFREGKGRSEIYYYDTKQGKIKSGAPYVIRRAKPLYQMKRDTEVLKKENGSYLIIYTPSHDISINDDKFKSFLIL